MSGISDAADDTEMKTPGEADYEDDNEADAEDDTDDEDEMSEEEQMRRALEMSTEVNSDDLDDEDFMRDIVSSLGVQDPDSVIKDSQKDGDDK